LVIAATAVIAVICVVEFVLCYGDCLLVVSRLEDKESEMKNEYTKLHERYTEVSLLD